MTKTFSITLDGEISLLTYGPFVDGEGVSHPASVLDLWSDEELAAIGVARCEAPPSRRLIPKSVVQERVNAVGKLGVAFSALQADPISFGRWFAPDHPNVYADDERLLQLLSIIGCTAEEIATVTAP